MCRLGFSQLWGQYKPAAAETTIKAAPKHTISSFDDAIDSILDDDSEMTSVADEYEGWLREPAWRAVQYKEGCTVAQPSNTGYNCSPDIRICRN